MKKRIAACHVHSEWSYDAAWTLPDLADEFARRGCDLILMTEHDRGWDADRWSRYQSACEAASNEAIQVVPGIEYSDPTNTIHILVWGAEKFFGEGLETKELLDRVKSSDAIAVFAHPERKNAWQKFDPDWCESLHGVEIWNRKTDGWAASSRGIHIWKSHSLVPFVGLDFHRRNQFFPLRMQVDQSDGESVEHVFEALRLGKTTPLFRGSDASGSLQSGPGIVLPAAERVRRVIRVLKP